MLSLASSLCLAASIHVGGVACAPTISTSRTASSSRHKIEVDEAETRHCLRLASTSRRAEGIGPDARTLGPEPPDAATSAIPPLILRTARAAGIEHVLEQLIAGPGERGVELRLQLVTRLSSLEIQLDAMLFEADCVGDQMEAVLEELDQLQRKRELGLAVSSLVLGAVAAIGGGVYELREAPAVGIPVISIVGGVAAVGLGLGAFVPGRDPVIFHHPRNILTPILAGEDPDHIYPEFVFHLLTRPTEDGSDSPREILLADWRRILDDAVPASQRVLAEQVLYGDGGVYDKDLIDVRERMFDGLESHLNSIERELELLYLFADRVIASETAYPKRPSM